MLFNCELLFRCKPWKELHCKCELLMLSLLSEYQVSVNENSIPRVSFGNVSLQYLKYTIFPMLYFYETMKFNFLWIFSHWSALYIWDQYHAWEFKHRYSPIFQQLMSNISFNLDKITTKSWFVTAAVYTSSLAFPMYVEYLYSFYLFLNQIGSMYELQGGKIHNSRTSEWARLWDWWRAQKSILWAVVKES